MPAALLAVSLAAPGGLDVLVPLPVMLGFYSSRAVILGLLLVFSGELAPDDDSTPSLQPALVTSEAREQREVHRVES